MILVLLALHLSSVQYLPAYRYGPKQSTKIVYCPESHALSIAPSSRN